MVSLLLKNPPYTVEDLADIPDDGCRYELIGGEIFVSPSPLEKHQRVSVALTILLGGFARLNGTVLVYTAPFDVRFGANDVVQPDLLVVSREHRDRIREGWIEGAPDIVVEILSSNSRGIDRIRKSALYASNGVAEYWLVDPEAETVLVQVLRSGVYVPLDQTEGEVRSQQLAEFSLNVRELFARPVWLDKDGS